MTRDRESFCIAPYFVAAFDAWNGVAMRRWVVLVIVGCLAGLSVGSNQAANATTTWSIMKSPSPAGSTSVDLQGVSCPRTISCFAVGFSQTGHLLPVTKALVEHWNGHTWSIMSMPTPADSTYSALFDIACPRPISCFAVGSFLRGPSTHHALIEHWNGHHWSTMPSPADGAGITLVGVSCPRTISCFAVGSAGNQTLIEHWNGHIWSIMSSPNPARPNEQRGTQRGRVSATDQLRRSRLCRERHRERKDPDRALERSHMVDHVQPEPQPHEHGHP